MASFRERTTDNGERRWQALVRRKGRPDLAATFSAKREAMRWASIQEGEAAEEKHLPQLIGGKHTVNELLDRYEPTLSPNKLKPRRAHLAWWRKEIGPLKLSELTTAVLSQARDKLRGERYHRAAPRKAVPLTGTARRNKNPTTYLRSETTVEHYVKTIRHALSYAEREWQWIAINPARGWRTRAGDNGRVRFLSADERTALLTACREQSETLYGLTLLALSTAARAGELTGLHWADVDLDRKRATLNSTKNKDRRVLSLSGPALALLAKWAKAKPDPKARVLPGFENRPYDYAKPFAAARTSAGIKDFRFHDTRHSAASYLAMGGASVPELAAVLGHRTLQMVQRYSHLSDQHVAGVVEKMNKSIFGPTAN